MTALPTLFLCLLIQQEYTEKGKQALADLQEVIEVESQMAQTADEIRAMGAKMDAARRARDEAKARDLELEWGRLMRRFQAERQEWMLKARRLVESLERGLVQSPDDRGMLEVRSQLAEQSIDPKELPRGLEDAEKLLKLKPGHGPYLITKAAILRQTGRFKEAADLLQQALSADANDPRARAYAALVAYDRFDFAAALEHLRRAAAAKTQLRPVLASRVTFTLAEEEIRAREREKDDLPRVELDTPKGKIVLELFENEAPNTVANFIELAESRLYDGTRFHRVEPNFMIQGGDPKSKNDDPLDDGTGNPGYRIPDEFGAGFRRHFRGSLSMANEGRPNTGGCQFFITLRVTDHLDGRHTVFGRVIEGMDVVDKIVAGDEIRSVRVLRKRPHEYKVRKL